ncbi:hypothetical protein VTG60DRAFT_4545 [Thermothelomyces hinnuleus]
MPFDCDLPSVLSLARSVAADLSRAPDVFVADESVVNALVLELDVLRRFCSARAGQAGGVDESSLAAHLLPCRTALKNMLDICQRYTGQTLGLGDGVRWKRDEKRFEKEMAALRQATTQLRETSQLLQQTAAASPRPQAGSPSPGQSSRGFRSTVSVSVSIAPSGPAAASQVSLPLSRSSTASLTTMGSIPSPGDATPLPMCPRGSGCREPYCHQKHSHPGAPQCEHGKNCCIPRCSKWHPKSPYCPNGPGCPNIDWGCSKAHPWPRVTQQQQQQQPLLLQSTDGSNYWGSQTTKIMHDQVGKYEYRVSGERKTPSFGPGTQITGKSPVYLILRCMLWALDKQTNKQTNRENALQPQPMIQTTLLLHMMFPLLTFAKKKVVSSISETGSAPDAGWCPLRFSCPGYNGACPLRHPRRAPCRDGNACTKGSACTYDHLPFQNRGGGNGIQGFVAELPASPRRSRYR